MSAPGPTDTGLRRFISSALLVEQIHQKGADGYCVGCRNHWRRLVPHPCTQAEWARLVLDRYDNVSPGPASIQQGQDSS